MRGFESVVQQIVRVDLELDADGSVPPSLEGDVGVQPHKARIRRDGAADSGQLADDEVPEVCRATAEPGIGVVYPKEVPQGLPAFGKLQIKLCGGREVAL